MARRKKKADKKKKGKPYKHPIPSPNELIDFLNEAGKPLKAAAIVNWPCPSLPKLESLRLYLLKNLLILRMKWLRWFQKLLLPVLMQ